MPTAVSQRLQQLRDLAACLRSHAAEIDMMAVGEMHDQAESSIERIQHHLEYVARVLTPKGMRK
jgi:acyl-CoA reductase-like NAD-dependent aldehyde dehydrogenase